MKRILHQFKEYYRLLFRSAAENQIRFNQGEQISFLGIKFKSYSHLKRFQKKLRRFSATFFLAFAAWFLGMVIGPVFFPAAVPTEVYIPNGRGDILISNVTKNQITVIFKTLDAANGNIPLATRAHVEVFGDENYRNFIKKTAIDDYAVTHIINIDKLDEEKMYYLRIIASDATAGTNERGTVAVSSWGDGRDPIKAFTVGNVVSKCITPAEAAAQVAAAVASVKEKEGSEEELPELLIENPFVYPEEEIMDPNKLIAESIEKESYLHDNSKIQTIISWITNKPASTTVLYREGTDNKMEEIPVSADLKTKHMAVIMTFKPGKMYYFKVKSVAEDGSEVISDEYSLLTPRAKETMLHTISKNFKSLVRQVLPK